MALTNTVGVDHVVIAVRDLERASETWRQLGFTLSPRGTHSAHLGTGNTTIMLGEDYIELLGVLVPTDYNLPVRTFLDAREGLERTAFTAVDSAALVAELQGRGLAATGPVDFGRPVRLANGTEVTAKFRTAYWPSDIRVGGMRLFACQHFTRDAVWLPELQAHANGATRIAEIEIVTVDVDATAARLGALIDQPSALDPDGARRIASGANRADFVVMTRGMLATRHPGVVLDGLPAEGAVGLSLHVGDDTLLSEIARRPGAVVNAGAVTLPLAATNGVLLTLGEG
jgi:catechol 2,3-dioxygenase-like lactoylglutathione lyase family enzyme